MWGLKKISKLDTIPTFIWTNAWMMFLDQVCLYVALLKTSRILTLLEESNGIFLSDGIANLFLNRAFQG